MSAVKEMLGVVFPFLNIKTSNPEEQAKEKKRESAQQWMPVADIDKGIIFLKNNYMVGMIRVHPVNISLLSDIDKKRKVEALASELNGIQDNFEIFCIGRPVDLTEYLEWLSARNKTETSLIRKRLLRNMIVEATKKVTSGEIQERRFYLCIFRHNKSPKEINEFISSLKSMREKIEGAALKTDLCDDDELINVCSMFSNPTYAGVESVSMSDVFDIPTFIPELGGS